MTPQVPGWLTQTLDLELIELIRKEGQTLNFKSQQAISYALREDLFKVVRERI
jgi:hypothetical protein